MFIPAAAMPISDVDRTILETLVRAGTTTLPEEIVAGTNSPATKSILSRDDSVSAIFAGSAIAASKVIKRS